MDTCEVDSANVVGRHRNTRHWDISAASLSTLCILHCLAVPLLVTVMPVLVVVSEAQWLHLMFVCMAVPISLWVIRTAWLRHESNLFVVVAILALSMMVSAITFAPPALEDSLTVVGAGMLGMAHLWRWWQHQSPEENVEL